MKSSVVIVNFHNNEKVTKLAKQLSSYQLVAKVALITNETSDLEKSQLEKSFAKGRKVKLVFNQGNLGFSKAVNQGIGIVNSHNIRIILINPDLEINEKALKAISESKFDICSPVLEFRRRGKKIRDFGGRVNLVLGRPTHLENYYDPRIDYVSGACQGISSLVIEKIGNFDERFFMYFEDVDFCLRAKGAGFSIGVEKTVSLNHHIAEHRKVKNRKKMEFVLKSNFKFINKWVRWFFKPIAFLYLIILTIKSLAALILP